MTDSEAVAEQKEAFNALRISITTIINRLTLTTVEESAVELIRENIIRGRGLLAMALLRTQNMSPELTPVLAALLSRLKTGFPVIVTLVCHRLVVEWTLAYRRKDWQRVEHINVFLTWLFIFRVIDVAVLLEVLVTCMSATKNTEENVSLATKLFQISFKAMYERSRREFHTVVLPAFRNMLAMDDDNVIVSARSQAALERCMTEVKLWEKKKHEEGIIPEALLPFEGEEEGDTVELELGAAYATFPQLDRFQFDPQYEDNERKYEAVRQGLLGKDWERELLEAVAAAEVEEEEARAAEAAEEGQEPTDGSAREEEEKLDGSKKVIDTAERMLRQEIFLAVRSSVRADEVVHKILKNLQPHTERVVCFMLIEGCCEEKSYRRIYEMSAERLCKSRSVFQNFFIEAFRERYRTAVELTMKQLEYSCLLFAHLLRTESLYWSRCLGVLDILHNDESQRLFIQHLFQALGQAMGMEAVAKRLYGDEEIRSHCSRLLCLEDRDDACITYAINLFVAMGLGELTVGMRQKLTERLESRKRSREE